LCRIHGCRVFRRVHTLLLLRQATGLEPLEAG
jgi:hypothetical protein